MDTTQLEKYIKEQMALGQTTLQLKPILLTAGWNEGVLDNVISKIQSEASSIQNHSKSRLDLDQEVVLKELPNRPTHFWDFKGMQWYEYLAMLPALIVVMMGGLLGALVGIASWLVVRIILLNKEISSTTKVLGIIGVYILGVVFYILFLFAFFFVLYGIIGGVASDS